MDNWNAEILSGFAGVIVSLVFAYLPGVKTWFDELEGTQKPPVMALVLFILSAGAMAYFCRFDGVCMTASAERFVTIYFSALVANMTTFNFAVKQPKQAAWEATTDEPAG